MKVAVAREEAKKLRAKADLGSDPMQNRHEERASLTMRELAKRYVDEWARPRKRPCSVKNDEIMLNRHIIPVIGSLRVNAVRYADIDRLHRKITQTAPIAANRCLSLLSKMFSLAIRWEMRTDNPTKGVSKNFEEGREVYFDAEALERLHAALAAFPRQPSADVVRLLLLTGARRGEVLSARWSQINFKTGTWVKPSSHTKQKRVHRLPLNRQAQELLQRLHEKRGDSDYVFPGRAVGPQTDLKKIWRTVSIRAGLKGTRIHDLRHTHASLLANSGESLQTIGRLLGHSSPNTTAKYSHLNDAALRAAVAIAGEAMAAADVGGKFAVLDGKHEA
jgi:integrase